MKFTHISENYINQLANQAINPIRLFNCVANSNKFRGSSRYQKCLNKPFEPNLRRNQFRSRLADRCQTFKEYYKGVNLCGTLNTDLLSVFKYCYRCSNGASSITIVEHRMGKSLQTSKRVNPCGIKGHLVFKKFTYLYTKVYRFSEKRKNVERRV